MTLPPAPPPSGDQPALFSLPPTVPLPTTDPGTPPLDPQSRAFRDNPVPVRDHEIAELAEMIHPADGPLGTMLAPEDHEAMHWDSGRIGPKSLDEARAALAARVADPGAPDDEDALGAYDTPGRHALRED